MISCCHKPYCKRFDLDGNYVWNQVKYDPFYSLDERGYLFSLRFMSPVGFRRSNWWSHDDVIKWKGFPRYWPFVRGIHRSPMNSAHKVQWRGDLMFSLICAWIKGCVNNREVGDLRRSHAHYDVNVMRWHCVTASWHEHVFHISGLLWGESTVVDPHNKAPVTWIFYISCVGSPQNLLNDSPVAGIWDTMRLIWCHCNVKMLQGHTATLKFR